MSTTATTPSELFISIDTTIRSQVQPNSITPETHSDLLYNMVEVLSANTFTNSGEYVSSASSINFTSTDTNESFSVTGITIPTSYNVVTALSASTPTQVTHSLNNPNIMVQTWDSNNDLVDMYVGKFSGDTDNIIVVESTVSDTFRINILGL